MSSDKYSNALPVTLDPATDRNEQRLLALKELTKVLKNNPESLNIYKLGLIKKALVDLQKTDRKYSENYKKPTLVK